MNGVETLRADGKASGTSQLDWIIGRHAAMKILQEKKDRHCFDCSHGFEIAKAACLLKRLHQTGESRWVAHGGSFMVRGISS